MHAISLRPTADGVLRTYARWFVLVSIAFFSTYPLCNWLAAHQSDTFKLYLSNELNIPFIPEFIWVYLSLYVLFLIPPFLLSAARMNALGLRLVVATVFCSLIFVIFPTTLGFDRVVPNYEFYGAVFSNMFAIDLPHNMVPSLHVVFSALILLAIYDAVRNLAGKIIVLGWLFLLSLSTILVHQHHLLDVATGLLVAQIFRNSIANGERHD